MCLPYSCLLVSSSPQPPLILVFSASARLPHAQRHIDPSSVWPDTACETVCIRVNMQNVRQQSSQCCIWLSVYWRLHLVVSISRRCCLAQKIRIAVLVVGYGLWRPNAAYSSPEQQSRPLFCTLRVTRLVLQWSSGQVLELIVILCFSAFNGLNIEHK